VLRKAYLNAWRGLEAGLRVRDIAIFDVWDCGRDEYVGDVAERVRGMDFDNVPVRAEGAISAVVEGIKQQPPELRVGEVARPLQEDMLVSGSMSLVAFLPQIANREYRLVVDADRILGLVTPSDVARLPVRLVVFTLLVHLEETMLSLIRVNHTDDHALDQLPVDRKEAVEETLEAQRRAGLNPSPLDATQFRDKAELLFRLQLLDDEPTARQLLTADLYQLRNAVDHVREYAQTPETLAAFLIHVQAMRTWIERLTEMFPPGSLGLPADDFAGSG
jgi:hypothetical protein